MKESPIFIKSYEMMVWLMGHTGKFPREQRFLMAKRMDDAALDFYAKLNEAARTKSGQTRVLAEADVVLANLKVYNRLSKDLKLLALSIGNFIGVFLSRARPPSRSGWPTPRRPSPAARSPSSSRPPA